MNKERFSELDSWIWFLTWNFFKECPDSSLSPDAFIEDGVIYNSTCSYLHYDIKDIRLTTIICDEDSILLVYQGRQGYDKGKLVYSGRHDATGEDNFLEGVKVYIKGEWEEVILREYERRKGEVVEKSD